MKFNVKLQKLRKEKGLSQEALAEMLNISRQAVSKWEGGVSYPDMENLISISDMFGVTLDSLIKDCELVVDQTNTVSEPYWASWKTHYEYKSKRSLFGIPLVHVNIGKGKKKAKGVIAIGNISTGVLSIGVLSSGILSVGVLGIGLLSIAPLAIGIPAAIGAVSIGIFSIGGIAIGVFTVGALSIGMFSLGACSFASHIAIGRYASGHIAIGEIVKGAKTIIDTSPHHDFRYITTVEVRQLINEEFPNLWNGMVNLVTMIFR